MTTVLSSKDLTKHYRLGAHPIRAVSEVSIAVNSGDIAVLQGPSGSGKSTLLNLLVGWERPDSGQISFKGEEVDPSQLAWSDIAIVPQRLGLLPELTAADNVTLPTRYGDANNNAKDILAAYGLDGLGEAYPAQLSQGQRQRIAVARATIVRPLVLIADEPTSSQDEESARLILDQLVDLSQHGTACLVASHDPITSEYATQIITMSDGTIQAFPPGSDQRQDNHRR